MGCDRIVTALLAAALVAEAALTLTACTFQPDPTEDNFYVKIVNDTTDIVVLRSCGTGHNLCDGKFYGAFVLKPDGVLPTVQTAVGASDPWLVRTPSGRRFGCLPLSFSYNASGAVVGVSEAVPCAKSYAARSKPGQ
jgi:hypothetical protein